MLFKEGKSKYHRHDPNEILNSLLSDEAAVESRRNKHNGLSKSTAENTVLKVSLNMHEEVRCIKYVMCFVSCCLRAVTTRRL